MKNLQLIIPELCVVALVGASGSGKSTFARTHFKPTEVLSSDYFRGLVSDDETDQNATPAAFDSLYYVARKRLDAGKLTVIDATNVQKKSREALINLAREQNLLAAAIVFDMGESICLERNKARTDRNFGAHVVRGHIRELKRSIRSLQKEGFRYVYVLSTPEEAETAEIVRTRLWNDKRDEKGPFDIVGDVHGCYDELCALLEKMDYTVDRGAFTALPPAGRRLIFLGDLCDRGPKNAAVLKLAMNMASAGTALCVPGNHDVKLLRKLRGADVKLTHGLGLTVEELEKEQPEFIEQAIAFLDGLVSHYVLDQGRLVVSHAGLAEKLQGRSSGRVREFCLYGETTGETDEFGLPVRINWAEEYRGRALVVYGHVPSREVRSLNNTVCIDTGCVFGGKLSAYRYPEGELAEVEALQEYYAPTKPLDMADTSADGGAEGNSGELRISDVLGKRHITTRLNRSVTISAESSSLTLEIMSRFSADPRWLIYLPPTMSPCGTSKREGYLEYPEEAFDYFLTQGVSQVICEEKHMGSRAVMILCRNAEIAWARFGIEDLTGSGIAGNSAEAPAGIIYTRTGRHFFDTQASPETLILSRLANVLDKSGFWDAFSTGWVCLDTELMPWSAKARQLLIEQYAPAGRSGRSGLREAIAALEQAVAHNQTAPDQAGPLANLPPANPPPKTADAQGPRSMDIAGVLEEFRERGKYLELYTQAYRRYCWPVNSVDDYRIAPFHILATEGKVWNSENHLRHLEVIREYMTGVDPLFIATNHLAVDLSDSASREAGIAWWQALTEKGGEGMVVKPLDFIARGKDGILQPAVKCRGREYLRIIYGPEYTDPARLNRLRSRSLGKKRRLALDEFSLGMEALERFVQKEPLHRIHECVFAVLALENEEVDPRL
ncbi:polynucleotide kinase-phosphatase [Leadbettera azotonutricia]|uniref:Metallophosphoesterase n=1 Tax=Leadbettera azotonutricia (strain ATCC BAA-888 / DSM 13862 / ZAS-9) TaxID=545695 RepID=F5YEI2_LEAAZ|nr:polynucleotide kinase-phosphatase [Leadbettera azotonutricia]AEF80517.1 metallophosphoesterase [Leadbettera azotonutricia ZAS-9]